MQLTGSIIILNKLTKIDILHLIFPCIYLLSHYMFNYMYLFIHF